MSDARIGHRRGLVALLLVTALATCTTDHTPTGPGRGGRGFLAIRPILAAPVDLAAFDLTIDNLRVIAIRLPSDTAADTTVAFSPDSSTLHLALPVVLNSNPETLQLVLELRAGGKVLFSGSQNVSVSAGPPDTSSAATVPLSYVGPGSGITHLVITPQDSVVNENGTQLFHATADAAGVPVDSFYVAWSTSDSGVAKINAQGLLKAPGARGTVLVRAITPNNVGDSTRVTFIPLPVALGIVSGNGQTATVTARLPLPLRVQVKASDSVGVKGVPVRFRAIAGDSVRDSVVASDPGGYAEDTVFFGTVAGTRRFVASVGALKPDTFIVTATAGAISAAQSIVTVSGVTVASGAVATLTLQGKDAFANSRTTGGATVAFSHTGGTSGGVVGTVTDHGDGTYTAPFTGVTAGTATTITATVNGAPVTTTLPTIAVTAGAISPLTSAVSTSSGTVASGASATLTLQAKDSSGNVLTTGGAMVVFSRTGGTSTGTISAATDHGNGTYTATFTGDTAGTATTIRATIGGVLATSTTTITVVPGNTTAAKSVITVSKDSIASGAKDTLTLQAKDSAGNNLTTGGLVVVFSRAGGTSTGTISATTDNNNGKYTAIFTGDTAGTATTIHATIGGQQVTSTLPTVTVIPGAISTAKSVVTSSDSVTTTGGVLTLTLTAKDAAGNALTKGGATVVFTQGGGTSTGTISATTDNANGTYTATFTGVNGGTATTIGATIGGSAVTSAPLPTIRVIATVHSADILADETWAAGSHTVTSYIRVRNGAKLTIALGATVKFDAGAGLQIGDTTLGQTGQLLMDGTQPGAAPGITLTANTGSPVPGFWKGIEVQRNLGLTTWRRALIEWAGGTRVPFGALPSEACILFVNRSGAEVDLDSVRIRQCVHAGIHDFGGIAHVRRSEIDSVNGSGIHVDFNAQLKLDSTVIRGSQQEGLLFGSTTARLLPSSGNQYRGNGVTGIHVTASQLPGLARQDSIAGNGTDLVVVDGGQPDPSAAAFTIFSQPQRAGANGYLVQNGLLDIGTGAGQSVTLDSNLVLRFGPKSGIVIGDSAGGARKGTIVSLGTNRTNAPRLTSASLAPAPGNWYGLEIGRLASNTRLANVRIEFAGDTILARGKYGFGLLVRSPAAQTLSLDSVVVVQSGLAGNDTNTAGIGVLGSGAGVDIRRSVAQGNLGYGFAVTGVPNVKILDDTAKSNTFGFGVFTDSLGISLFTPADSVARNVATANVLYPLSLDIRRLPVLYDNAFAGNGRDTALLHGGTFPFAGTLPHFAGVPWHVPGGIQIDSGGVLTLAPRDTIAFDSLAGITVGDSAPAALRAVSTGGPVLLTPASGNTHWFGLQFRQLSQPDTLMNVVIEKAGFIGGGCQIACDVQLLIVFGSVNYTNTTPHPLVLDSVTIRQAVGYAVSSTPSGGGTVSVEHSQFYANAALYNASTGAALTVTGSDISHYGKVVVVNHSSVVGDSVDATNNWWGDVLGPDSGSVGADSLGRTTTAFSAVRTLPFATAAFFPVGTATALVATRDSLAPALSTSALIGVRAVDASGRGVPGVSITWSAPSGTSITPLAGTGDGGGRFISQWQFTTSAGRKVATATASGLSAAQFVANVQPDVTFAEDWTLVPALSQGTVTGPKAITFTSTNRRGVIVTNAHDQFNNPTQPSSHCSSAPGQGCISVFPEYAPIDSTHTSNGVSGDTIFFHSNITTPSPFVLRAQYATGSAPLEDSVVISMIAIPGGVKIDRDPNQPGVQAAPDTVQINSLCPTGPGSLVCQGTYTALVVDSGLTPIGQGNANFAWNLVSGTAVTFDSQTAVFPHDVGFVTARSNGFARLAVKDVSGNNFGTDTLPILVRQTPSVVQVTPDTVSVLVGGTTTLHGTVVDAAGDPITRTVHWRNDNTFNRHLTIVDTSVANQVTVRLDSTPFGRDSVTAFTDGDTAVGSGKVLNPVQTIVASGVTPIFVGVNSVANRVYVADQGDNFVTVLDANTNNVITSIDVGSTSQRLSVNPKTNTIYVAGSGSPGLRVIDGASNTVTTTIAIAAQGSAVDTARNRVYVGTTSGPLYVVNGATNTIVDSVQVPRYRRVAYNPVTDRIYVATPSSDSVKVIDASTLTVIDSMQVGNGVFNVVVNPVTNRIYTTNTFDGTVSVIDGTTDGVIATIPGLTLQSIAIDPARNLVYVGEPGFVLVIDGATNAVRGEIDVGGTAGEAQPNPATGRVYVAVEGPDQIRVLRY